MQDTELIQVPTAVVFSENQVSCLSSNVIEEHSNEGEEPTIEIDKTDAKPITPQQSKMRSAFL